MPTTESIPPNSWAARLADWLRTGRIVADHTDRVSQLQTQLQQDPPTLTGPTTEETYNLIKGMHYNLAQNRRMVNHPDSVYQAAVEVRLLYSLMDICSGYFQIRNIPWRSEKAAIRYLEAHDPSLLALWQDCLQAGTLVQKVALSEHLIHQALAPAGGLWPPDTITVSLEVVAVWSQELIEQGAVFGRQLLTV